MPLYAYVALAENGAYLMGETVAASEEALRTELSGRGLLVQQVRSKRPGLGLRSRRVRPEEFALFNQEFMALVRAGLTVLNALALASDRPDSPALGKILARVHEDVRNGVSLSDACARHPEAFERLYLAAVRTGEKTGDLAAVLALYQDYLRHRVALRKKVSQALAYPMFLLIALMLILAVLFVFVMPRFVAMYADLGAALPFPTRVLLSIVDHLYIVGPALVGIAALAAWGWRSWRATALMPPMAARMIEVGEASGGLDAMLAEVARFYEEVLDSRLARVMALIEPLLMLLMGLLIGGIIIVMYLPVFHMADIIK